MTENRVAIVTGASRGIGNAIAAKLASEGYAIVAVGTSDLEKVSANLQKIKQSGTRFAYVQADVSTDPSCWDELDVIATFAARRRRSPIT